MIKFIVAVFNSADDAFKGLTAFKDLHNNADITLYASTVLTKNATGNLEVVQADDSGPVSTTIGLFTGALIGVLAGPIGVGIGALAGSTIGFLYDLYSSDIDDAFINEVSKALVSGKFAVVVEADESWTTPVDNRIHELGGLVFRRFKSEAEDDQMARESAAFKAELASLKEELKAANAENKAAIEKNIDTVKAQLHATEDRVKAKLDQIEQETEAQVQVLEEQVKTKTGRAKDRIEERIATTKSNHQKRSRKLHQAWVLIKEALSG